MKRPVLWVSIAFLAGVIYRLIFSDAAIEHLLLSGTAFSAVIGLGAVLICLRIPKMRKQMIIYYLLALAFFLFGVFHTCQYQVKEQKTEKWLLSQERLIGTVTGADAHGFRLVVRTPYGGKFGCIVWTKDGTEPEEGSIVSVSGERLRISEPENPGEFDFKAYYRAIGILAECNADQTNTLAPPGKIISGCNRMRKWIVQTIRNVFTKKSAGVITAILLGEKSGMDQELTSVIQKLGGSHIFSVSGMHFTVLSGMLMLLLERLLQKKYAALFGVPFLLFWGVLVGFPVSCVRAFALYVLAALARALGRPVDGITGLGVIADLCIGARPVQILDMGTQFSFLAVFCFLSVIPCWNQSRSEKGQQEEKEGAKKKAGKIQKWQQAILTAIKTSLMIQLCMLPIFLYRYWVFSPYSVFYNLFLVTALPWIFTGSIVVIGIAAFSTEAAHIAAVPVQWSIRQMLPVGKALLKLPGAVIVTGQPELWGILLYILVLGVLSLLCYRKGFHFGRLTILLMAVGLLFRMKCGEPVVSFLSVGQGACAVIQSGQAVCVVDCGSSSRDKVGEETLLNYLHFYGYHAIDLLVVSHLDDDHRNGVDELLDNGFAVRRVIFARYEDSCGEMWLKEKQYQGTFDAVVAGDVYGIVSGKSLVLKVLWPKSIPPTSENSSSLGILVEVGNQKLLFCGDTDADGLLAMAEECGEIDVLVVPHHGSRFSVSEEAYRMLRPKAAVISCGKNNRYGHPHEETLRELGKIGARIYRIDENGAIQMKP